MSTLSQFTGGGGAIIGESVTVFDAPINFTVSGKEYLRHGSLIPYSADYAAPVAAMPALGVYGTSESILPTVGGIASTVLYIGTKYVAVYIASRAPEYASSLSLLATAPTASTGAGTGHGSVFGSNVASSGTHIVVAGNGGTQAPVWTSDGITYTTVGGAFWSINDTRNVTVFGNNSWIVVGVAGMTTTNYAYIDNVDPTGTWTAVGSALIGATCCGGAYGNGTFLVATVSTGNPASGKLYTIASAGAALVDRTVNLTGVLSGDALQSVVYTGTHFIVATSFGKAWRSADAGLTWTRCDFAETNNLPRPYAPTGVTSAAVVNMKSDGAGRVLVTVGANSPIVAESTDHGLTWVYKQIFAANGLSMASRYMNYANSKWITSFTSTSGWLGDLGAMTTPDYVGRQTQVASAQFVRIK